LTRLGSALGRVGDLYGVAPHPALERLPFGPHGALEAASRSPLGSLRWPLGRLWHRSSAGEEWRRIRAAANLPDDVTLYALRHTYASSLIAAGCDVVTVQRALGHAQPSITLHVYSHLWPPAEDKTRAATAGFMAEIAASAHSLRTEAGKLEVRAWP